MHILKIGIREKGQRTMCRIKLNTEYLSTTFDVGQKFNASELLANGKRL